MPETVDHLQFLWRRVFIAVLSLRLKDSHIEQHLLIRMS